MIHPFAGLAIFPWFFFQFTLLLSYKVIAAARNTRQSATRCEVPLLHIFLGYSLVGAQGPARERGRVGARGPPGERGDRGSPGGTGLAMGFLAPARERGEATSTKGSHAGSPTLTPVAKVRQEFPESWIWTEATIG